MRSTGSCRRRKSGVPSPTASLASRTVPNAISCDAKPRPEYSYLGLAGNTPDGGGSRRVARDRRRLHDYTMRIFDLT